MGSAHTHASTTPAYDAAIIYSPKLDKVLVAYSISDTSWATGVIDPRSNIMESYSSSDMGELPARVRGILYNPSTDVLQVYGYVQGGSNLNAPFKVNTGVGPMHFDDWLCLEDYGDWAPGSDGKPCSDFEQPSTSPEDTGSGVIPLGDHGSNEITKMCVDPEHNIIYLFDGSVYSSQTNASNSFITVNSTQNQIDGVTTVTHENVYNAGSDGLAGVWLDVSQKTRDVIYCPFDNSAYWLSSPDGSGETKILKTNPSTFENKIIYMRERSGDYHKLVYCPDNNMIYVIGTNKTQMIHADDTRGQTEVAQFFDDNINIPHNGVVYSFVNNRIYGVGDDGYVKYINPTS